MKKRIIFLLFSILLLSANTIFAATGATIEKKIQEPAIVWITSGTTGKQRLNELNSKIFLPSKTGKRVVYVQIINPKDNEPDKLFKTKEYEHPHIMTVRKNKSGQYLYDMTTYYFGKSDNAGLELLIPVTLKTEIVAQKLQPKAGSSKIDAPVEYTKANGPKTEIPKKVFPKLPEPKIVPQKTEAPKTSTTQKEFPKFESRAKGSIVQSYNTLKLAGVPSESKVKAAFIEVSNDWLPKNLKNATEQKQKDAKVQLDKINEAYREFSQIFTELKIFGLPEIIEVKQLFDLDSELKALLEQDQIALTKLGKSFGKKIENFESTQQYKEIKAKRDRLLSTSYPKLMEYAKFIEQVKYKK